MNKQTGSQPVEASPTILKEHIFHVSVCVPEIWDDKRVEKYIEQWTFSNCPKVRKEGDPALQGTPERLPCEKYPGFVHMVVDL